MVNPRWRPTIANSRKPLKGSHNETETDIPTFPKPEPYIGRYIDGEIAGVKVSNPSYKKYYKDLV